MNFKKIFLLSVLTGFLLPSVYADPIEVVGSIPQTIQQGNPHALKPGVIENKKIIQLMKVKLSDEKRAQLLQQSKDAAAHKHQFAISKSEDPSLPSEKQLGMNKVPVLDQGIHGTCVTFAVTGALDAAIGKGDYLSQVCNLQLGSYLELMGYSKNSGWDGTTGKALLEQIQQYGVVNVDNQSNIGCGGLKKYPTNSPHRRSSYIHPSDFAKISEPVLGAVANVIDVDLGQDGDALLRDTKAALNAGDRLVFATLLPRTDLGTSGAVGRHYTWYYHDTWLLTPEILDGVKTVESAHEMIIVGYDDNAVATDPDGKKHKGLLAIRNSWGTGVGYWGEFYMSYDYFKLLGWDVKRISKISS